jgi:hypothetical protein
MTKKLTDLEYQAQQSLVKKKWRGHPLNNSDIGYDEEWDIQFETTGPFNPNEKIDEDTSKN